MEEHLVKIETNTMLEVAITILLTLTVVLVVAAIALKIYFWLTWQKKRNLKTK